MSERRISRNCNLAVSKIICSKNKFEFLIPDSCRIDRTDLRNKFLRIPENGCNGWLSRFKRILRLRVSYSDGQF